MKRKLKNEMRKIFISVQSEFSEVKNAKIWIKYSEIPGLIKVKVKNSTKY